MKVEEGLNSDLSKPVPQNLGSMNPRCGVEWDTSS